MQVALFALLLAAPPLEDELIGGAVQPEPIHEVPKNAYAVSEVIEGDRYEPFGRHVNACGIVLAATEGVEDEFLALVGQSIAESFPRKKSLDLKKQREVIEALHAYGALLPVPNTERELERLFRKEGEAIDALHARHSLCDIIMADVPEGQVMEVVEHVLHTVTDVAFHHVFPEEWGLTRESKLWEAMQLALEAGHYDISGYDDLEGAPQDVLDRILMQEFAYWFITTAWDLQTDYGPNEDEWTLRTPAELKEALPEFWTVYERTAARVMVAPSRETLKKIGPTRAEER